MSYDNQQHPAAPISFHEGGYRKNAYNYPNSGVHLPDQAGNVVQRQTSPRNLQQGKPSTDIASLDKIVKDLKDSSGPVGDSVPGFPPSSAAPSPSIGNVIQRQTSPKNLQQGKLPADGPSLDKARKVVQGQTSPRNLQQGKPFTDVPSLETAENIVQRQTSPENLQQVKLSTDVPSLDKVVKELKESSGPVGGSIPGFPPSPIAPSPSTRNVIQRQTSPRNLQQGKPLTRVSSLDKVGNDVQCQTSPGNLQQGKPSTDVPSFDNVIKDLKSCSGPVGGSIPNFPPSSTASSPSENETNCIRKCLAALSPCCIG